MNNRKTANQAIQSTKTGNNAKTIASIIASPIIPPALICLVSTIISPPVEFRFDLYIYLFLYCGKH